MATTKVRMPVTEAVMERGESLASDMARDACVPRLGCLEACEAGAGSAVIKAFSKPACAFILGKLESQYVMSAWLWLSDDDPHKVGIT
jgi:hypothetical protein